MVRLRSFRSYVVGASIPCRQPQRRGHVHDVNPQQPRDLTLAASHKATSRKPPSRSPGLSLLDLDAEAPPTRRLLIAGVCSTTETQLTARRARCRSRRRASVSTLEPTGVMLLLASRHADSCRRAGWLGAGKPEAPQGLSSRRRTDAIGGKGARFQICSSSLANCSRSW